MTGSACRRCGSDRTDRLESACERAPRRRVAAARGALDLWASRGGCGAAAPAARRERDPALRPHPARVRVPVRVPTVCLRNRGNLTSYGIKMKRQIEPQRPPIVTDKASREVALSPLLSGCAREGPTTAPSQPSGTQEKKKTPEKSRITPRDSRGFQRQWACVAERRSPTTPWYRWG